MMFTPGAKFTASSRGMRIIERTGTSLMLESTDMEQRLTQETQKLLEYVKEVLFTVNYEAFNLNIEESLKKPFILTEILRASVYRSVHS